MKSFFNLFKISYREIAGKRSSVSVINLTVIGLLIALSMAIEALTIPVPFGKLNFAFLAIAAIGMLFGPTVGFLAGGICDIVGYAVHPDGGFLPLYILIAALQGLIYGLILYRKWGSIYIAERSTGKKFCELSIRLIAARLCDVIIINLLLNTAANLHYGFIPQQAFATAVSVRLTKNVLELFADIPLLLTLMPVVLAAYSKAVGKFHLKGDCL